MQEIILIGYGGHGKSVADAIENSGEYRILGYVDNEDKKCEYRYLGTDKDLPHYLSLGYKHAALCIGYLGKGTIREEIYSSLKRLGFILPAIVDPSAIVANSALIEEGCFIGKRAVINSNAIIEPMCIINTGAIIEHDCHVEAFSHISVATVLCGQVTIGRAAFVGANATVIQCRKIKPNEIIPAGSTVR